MSTAFVEKLRRSTGLDEPELARVIELCTVAEAVPAHTEIVKEGEASGFLHVVLAGWACCYRSLADGRRQFLALLLPGDTCDLDRLLMDEVAFGVAALTACKVARLPRDKLLALIDDSPSIRRAFWWLTCVEKAAANEWAVCLGRRSALERLAHLLCELEARLSVINAVTDHSYVLPVTQEELADALGMSVVHVNRTIQTLRHEGLVTLESRRLTILDRDALVRLCDFKPNYLHLEGVRLKSAPARRLSLGGLVH